MLPFYSHLFPYLLQVIIIILLQITYRRKKQKKSDNLAARVGSSGRNRGQRQGYGYYQRRVDENTGLLERTTRTWCVCVCVFMCLCASWFFSSVMIILAINPNNYIYIERERSFVSKCICNAVLCVYVCSLKIIINLDIFIIYIILFGIHNNKYCFYRELNHYSILYIENDANI